MTSDQTSLLSDEDLRRELSAARSQLEQTLAAIGGFAEVAHDEPWRHLDDLLGDLRAAAVTVAVLERLQARGGL